MYRMKLDETWLFNEDYADYTLEKATLNLEVNKLSTLKFTIYDTNPAYFEIKKITSLIKIYRDNTIIGLARPVKAKLNFRRGVDYTCEDVLSRLNDIKKRPGYFKGTEGQYLQHLIDDYNSHVSTPSNNVETISIEVGETPHSGSDATLEFFNDDYVGYWDLIQDKLIKEYGGYIRPTYSESKIIIDYVDDDSLLESEQSIRFGENLDSLFIETDSAKTFSVLIPLGKDVNNPSAQGDMSKNTPLTIKSVNSQLDYLENAEGIALYGRREETMRWEDISSAQELKDKGLEYLSENAVKLTKKITLTAIDLHYAGVNIEYLNHLTRVYVESIAHDVGDRLTLKKMQLSLNSPTASKIELGDEQETLTDRMASEALRTSGAYKSLNSRVFDLENV